MTREELQAEAASLIRQHPRVVLQWCTGLGKSRAAIDMANWLSDKKKESNDEPLSVLLVVAETAHKTNWQEEIDRWGLQACSTVMECYASLHKYRNTHWDLVIFDEAHHLASDLRMDILTELHAYNVIMLSATFPEQVLQAVASVFGKFTVHRVSLRQAVEWGILPEPKVYLVPLALDDVHYDCTIVEEWGKEDRRVRYRCSWFRRWKFLRNRRKYPDVSLEIACTQKQKYDWLTEQFTYWKKYYMRTRQEFAKNRWLQAGSRRKRFLGELKTPAAKALLQELKDCRYICFCASIEQAENLGGENSIHSKKADSLEIVEKFNTGKINSLYAVGLLQEGQNLTDIQAGVIIQLDGQERVFIQKMGRAMRADSPVLYVLYYENTRDEEYLASVYENIDSEFIAVKEKCDEDCNR